MEKYKMNKEQSEKMEQNKEKGKEEKDKEEKSKEKKRRGKKAYRRIIKNIEAEYETLHTPKRGKGILSTCLIVIPILICLLCFFANEKHIKEVYATVSLPLEEHMLFEMLNTVIAIIAIAVSVWIGLNIYNVYKKSDIDAEIRELQEKNIKTDREYQKRKFLYQLEKTERQYEGSKYLYNLFDHEMVIPSEIWNQLSIIEKNYADCCRAYERREPNICKSYAMEIENQILFLECLMGQEQPSFMSCVETYLNFRESDILFYKNALDKDKDKNELVRSIELYKTLMGKIHTQNSDVIAYMQNTIGYTYFLLYSKGMSQDTEEREGWYNGAEKYLNLAVNNNGKKGRYKQNLGACLEQKGDYENALKTYKEAYNSEIVDPKIYNLLGSLCLKNFEKEMGISNRFQQKQVCLLCDMNTNISEEQKRWLEEGFGWLMTGIRQPSPIIDIYYNYAKANIFYWIFIDKKKGSKIEESKFYLNTVEYQEGARGDNRSLPRGYMFTLRNYWEAIGEIEKALEINNKISGGDTEQAKKCYSKYLEVHKFETEG